MRFLRFDRRAPVLVALGVLSLLVLSPVVGSAQGLIAEVAGEDGATTRQLVPLQSLAVELALTDVSVGISEQRTYSLAGVSSAGPASVRFYRPLTGAANLSVVSASVGDGSMEGEILDPEAADALRRELAIAVVDPVMLRDLGSPMFVSAPFEAPVGGFNPPLQLGLSLQATLVGHGTMLGASVPVDWHRQPAGSVSVDVTATTDAPLRTLYAPYHTLALTRGSEHQMTGTYQGYQRCTAFEVTVLLSTGDEPVRLDLLPHRDTAPDGSYGDEAGTWLALLSTGAAADGAMSLGRDIILVLDRSGSMKGEKMEQAKAALTAVLGGLRPQDNVAVVAFDKMVETFGDAAPATPDQVKAAQSFVHTISADGGTNIHDALQTAFSTLPTQTEHPRYVVFLTDGQATEGETDTQAILTMAKASNEVGARIFAFGIGHDVNTVLLDSLALDSSGDALYIQPGQSVDATVEAFFDQIADPVLTNPALDTTGVGGGHQYPSVLDDLFAGQTVAVLGRYTQPGPAQIVLSGDVGGTTMTYVFDVTLPAYATDAGYVPRVWARRRVGALLQQIKLGNADPALVQEAMALANRYGVVTEFTFFSLDEDGNMAMTWSDVPVAAVGSSAVSTSASIDAYQKGGTVDGTVDAWIRYHADRTFPTSSGWYTDTALEQSGPGPWIDLHFGSEAFWGLLEAERSLGIGGFLSVAANNRFEFLGRRFRVTDPATAAAGGLPPESPVVPSATTLPAPEVETRVSLQAPGADGPEAPSDTARVDPTIRIEVEGERASEAGCSSTGRPTGVGGLLSLWALGLMALFRRRITGLRGNRPEGNGSASHG